MLRGTDIFANAMSHPDVKHEGGIPLVAATDHPTLKATATMKILSFRYLLVSGAILLISSVDSRKDTRSTHPHQGILKRYNAGPFENLSLGKKDEVALESGKPVMKQIMPGKDSQELGGTAICIQDVNAPKSAVWNQILGLDNYEGKVPKVKKCNNYTVRKNPDGSHTIKTLMKIGIMPGYSVRTDIGSVRELPESKIRSPHSLFDFSRHRSTPTITTIPMFRKKTPWCGLLITISARTLTTLLDTGIWRTIRPSRCVLYMICCRCFLPGVTTHRVVSILHCFLGLHSSLLRM